MQGKRRSLRVIRIEGGGYELLGARRLSSSFLERRLKEIVFKFIRLKR